MKLFRFKKKEELVLPQTIEVIEGELRIKVFYHDVCHPTNNQKVQKTMGFLTEGFHSLGQKEILFVMLNKRQQYYELPQEPALFFKQLYLYSKQNKNTTHGSITQFGERDFMGWKGVIYTDISGGLFSMIENPTLNMLLVSNEEIKAAQEFGNLRVLSMLGKKYRFYPYPYWSELDRSEVMISQMAQSSILPRIQKRLIINTSTLVSTGAELRLTIPKTFNMEIPPEGVVPDSPLVIHSMLSETADACLTYCFVSEQRGPEAISPPNSQGQCIGACFLLLIPNQEHYGTRVVEDGYSLMMLDTQWVEFWNAFKAKENFQIKSQNDLSFVLEWV